MVDNLFFVIVILLQKGAVININRGVGLNLAHKNFLLLVMLIVYCFVVVVFITVESDRKSCGIFGG